MAKRKKGWKRSDLLKLFREGANKDGLWEVHNDDLSIKIPTIINRYVVELSKELGEQLRAAAQVAKPYLRDEDVAALRAGFALGQEWQKWALWVNSPPILNALEKKGGSDRGTISAREKRWAEVKVRQDEVKVEAKKLIDKNLATKQIVHELKKDFGKDDDDDKTGFSDRALRDLVLELKAKNPGRD
jgi:hypothetical protein